jgi:dihydrofolate reductase
MGSIKSGLFISLDGVVEAPETWHLDYFNDEMGAAVGGLMDGQDAMLLGRVTYDAFADYWPKADPNDPLTIQMNGTPKYVVSTTLTEPTWENSTVIGPDAIASVKTEFNLGVTGSATLVNHLLRARLLDELHLFVHPVFLGSGSQVFRPGDKIGLKLANSTVFQTGVLHTVYTPA